MSEQAENEILYGLPAIAENLRISTRQAKHLAMRKGLPVFRLGRRVCAKSATLAAWLAAQEAAGIAAAAERASATVEEPEPEAAPYYSRRNRPARHAVRA